MEQEQSSNITVTENTINSNLEYDTPKTKAALERLQELMSLKVRNYGKSIGYTKPTLESRVANRRLKEKQRRKLNNARRRATR